MPVTVSDWFTIARSGATIDGRELSAATLKKIAASYDPALYTAVINYEHMYGNLGSVRELRCVESGGGKVDLQARIAPNKYYYLYNAESMGIFFSIEYIPKFADTGEPYLFGLAATNRPASLATSELHFSFCGHEDIVERGEPVKAEKLTVEEPAAHGMREAIFSAFKEIFSTKKDTPDMTKEELSATLKEELATFKQEQMAAIDERFAALGTKSSTTDKTEPTDKKTEPGTDKAADGGDYKADYAKLQESYAAMKAQIEQLSAKIEELSTTKTDGKADKTSAGPSGDNNDFIL
ncbi:MAG: GPO family capsid scaffolding protein [Victivallaceae bacterium]|nr:GPO family capsid scaffolding protein [Victivallaceae bacterium]